MEVAFIVVDCSIKQERDERREGGYGHGPVSACIARTSLYSAFHSLHSISVLFHSIVYLSSRGLKTKLKQSRWLIAVIIMKINNKTSPKGYFVEALNGNRKALKKKCT